MKVAKVERYSESKTGQVIDKEVWENCNFTIDATGVVLYDSNGENRKIGKIEDISTGYHYGHQLCLTVLVDCESYNDYDVYVREKWYVRF